MSLTYTLTLPKSVLLSLILLLTFFRVFAQSDAVITGRVIDMDKEPVVTAAAALYRLSDSMVMDMVLTDTSGSYMFGSVKPGTYFTNVSMLGFIPFRSVPVAVAPGASLRMDDILLESSTNLQEVSITAKKAMIVRKQDRTVVNVDAMLTGAGTTALDILSKSPGVQVDQNGVISLRGKQGVTVLIDDRPTYLSGDELASYLRSLPSSALDQVELITNPPARYDAAGNAGIINIKIKRNKGQRWNGSLNLSVAQGQMTRSNNSVNLNYSNKKISTFANLSYNLNNSFTDLDLYRTYKNPNGTPASYFNQNSYFDRHGNTFSGVAGGDYYITERATIGMVLNGMARQSTQLNDNTSKVYDDNDILDSVIVAKNNDDINFKNGGVNLNFRKQFHKEGRELTADGDYINYRNLTKQVYRNDVYNTGNSLQSQDVLLGRLPNHVDIYTAKTDYVHPFNSSWKLGSGAKYSNIKTDNTADYKTTTAGVTVQDYNKSNHFIYTEQISAAYVNLSREGVRLSLQSGLRVEHTRSDGHQLGNIMKADSAFTRDYTNLFPTFFLSYKFDSAARHQAGFNYGRRIDRPYYQDLNPFLYPMDKFTYYTGNPFLKPSLTQAIDLSYTYNNKVTASLSYSKSRDNVNETIEIQDGIYYSRPGNIGSKTTYTLSVDGSFNPLKWLSIHAYTEAGNITTQGAFLQREISTSGNYWFGSCDARFSFGKGWDAELSGNYRTRIYDAQFIIEDISQVAIAVQKKIGTKYNLKLTASDLLYGQVIHGTITNLQLAEAGWVNKRDTRQLVASISYQFGKRTTQKTRYTPTGADDEKGRVKG